MHRRQQVATIVGDQQLDDLAECPQSIAECVQEAVDAVAGEGTDGHRTLVPMRRDPSATSGAASHLLNTSSSGRCAAPISAKHLAHRGDLALGIGRRAVDDVNQVVAASGDLERALERLDQSVRQVADEADRVGDQHRLAAGQRQSAGRRIERGEQSILDQHAGMGEMVEQRRLPGVGVADDGHRGEPAAASGSCAADRAGGREVLQIAIRAW